MSASQSAKIELLLRAKSEEAREDGSGDVVFALFLEPSVREEETHSLFDKIINFAVTRLQPSPVMIHVELVVPCSPQSELPLNFATYIGNSSDWQADRKQNERYYLQQNAGRWRAVPVFAKHAARLVREECDRSLHVPYSLLRYATAAWGVRKLSGLVPDERRSPAHCATLTARILKHALKFCTKHCSAYYGPATLYAELTDKLAAQRIAPENTQLTPSALAAVDRLLRESDERVTQMAASDAMSAIRALTLKAAAAEAFSDSAASVLTQKQLATGLLRWSVHRRTQWHI